MLKIFENSTERYRTKLSFYFRRLLPFGFARKKKETVRYLTLLDQIPNCAIYLVQKLLECMKICGRIYYFTITSNFQKCRVHTVKTIIKHSSYHNNRSLIWNKGSGESECFLQCFKGSTGVKWIHAPGREWSFYPKLSLILPLCKFTLYFIYCHDTYYHLCLLNLITFSQFNKRSKVRAKN